jgi:hypothetical protein
MLMGNVIEAVLAHLFGEKPLSRALSSKNPRCNNFGQT